MSIAKSHRLCPNSCGSVLPVTLVLVAMISYLSAMHFMYSLNLISQIRDEQHSLITDHAASEEAISSMIQMQSLVGTKARCESADKIKGFVRSARSICWSQFSASGAAATLPVIDGSTLPNHEFPLFRYTNILEPHTSCVPTTQSNFSNTVLGFPITQSALVSSRTCHLTSGVTTHHLSIDGNLASSTAISLGQGTGGLPGQIPTLAASGYIDSSGVITASSDALIIAGGDLHVGLLQNADSTPKIATLVSATGFIRLDSVQGSISLRLIAKEGYYIPAGSTIAPSAPIPEVVSKIPLGIFQELD